MASDPTEYEEIDLRIRTLSATLHQMQFAEEAKSAREDVPPFLRAIANLLTTGAPIEKMAKQVLAVAAGAMEDGFKTVVVTQSKTSTEDTFSNEVEEIERNTSPFSQIIAGPARAPLKTHVADLMALLSICDRTNVNEVTKLTAFVTMRSIYKLYSRLLSDKHHWNRRVWEILSAWKPTTADGPIEPLWVKRPRWADVSPTLADQIDKRQSNGHEEWNFSTSNAGVWAQALGGLLHGIEVQISKYKALPGKAKRNPLSELITGHEKRKAEGNLRNANRFLTALHDYASYHSKILKVLLTQKSLQVALLQEEKVCDELGDGAARQSTPGEKSSEPPVAGEDSDVADDLDDLEQSAEEDVIDLRAEVNESQGARVFRYIEMVTAWHAAAQVLTSRKNQPIMASVSVGLVEVAGSKSDVMDVDAVLADYIKIFPASPPKPVLDELKTVVPRSFGGVIHAESALMGLLSYFTHYEAATVHVQDLIHFDNLGKLLQPALSEPAIAVGNKCCWCCYKLAQILKDSGTEIKVPGTHGKMYAWCSPRVGIPVPALKKLEEALWKKLNEMIQMRLDRRKGTAATHSRQSSGTSTGSADSERLLMDVEYFDNA